MEKVLIKSGIYGLLLGLAISILFVNYKVITPFDGGYTTEYKPVFDYIISIIRIGIVGMFLGLFIGWKSYERKHQTQQGKSYYLLVFFAVLFVSIIVMAVFNW